MKSFNKNQAIAILVVVTCIIGVIFITGAVSRITNCNFHNIGSQGIDELTIMLNYANDVAPIEVSLSGDEAEDMLNILSKYDYGWTNKSFFGTSTSISGEENGLDLIHIIMQSDSKRTNSILMLSNGEMKVSDVNYNMARDKATMLISEVSSYVTKGE